MSDWAHTRTDRLWLDRPEAADVGALHAIYSDPASWTHFPQGRHDRRDETAALVVHHERLWDAHGLSGWVVREQPSGPVVGWTGVSVPDGRPWWNLAYRFETSVQGRGYAVEAARTAIAAAHDVEPERPVLAYLLEHNVGSRRTAEKLGLRLVWRGPDAGNDDPAAVRLVYLDREPDEVLLAALVEG
ncbi:GNAT family N-acetyltransferase [Nocardioides hwasunensis]|uniref:GNAT family N-acetyltransferase n=1 Tax=Nocardioides hwasunensis TaxID=397258 RepID=A0ABR8MEH8_9ACTN|nr:GNAT family N-acetyltransferase [Nocardioides hwasunensis]MBD3914283.1 GNAT family N-acetyltransferase [Nocardioides hwasunensis]